jgi:glycine dehydrogenase subunit 1
VFEAPLFHETVVRLSCPVAPVLEKLEARGILGGLDLHPWYPELGNGLLICATETKTDHDLATYASALADCLKESAC